MHFLTSDVVFD